MSIIVNPKVLLEVDTIMSKIEYRRKQEVLNGKRDRLLKAIEAVALNEPLEQEDFEFIVKSLEYSFKKKFLEKLKEIKEENININDLPEKYKGDKVIKLLITYMVNHNIELNF